MLFDIKNLLTILFLAIFALLMTDAFAKTEMKTFTLPPIDGEPYTMQIPIQISKTGMITTTVKLAMTGVPDEKMLYVSLHQENNRYALKADYLNRMQGLHLRHEVDMQELARGAEYFLTLTNYSHSKIATGEVKISYPVVGEVETRTEGGPSPNLVVDKVYLDDRCEVMVSLKNGGPGPLPTYYWKVNMPELKLIKDGQEWGKVDIRFFDYSQALSPVGGEAVYNTGLKIIGSSRIMAVVDSNEKLREQDETDNAVAVELICE